MMKIDLTNYPERSVSQLLKGNKEFNIMLNTYEFWCDVETELEKTLILTPQQLSHLKTTYWV